MELHSSSVPRVFLVAQEVEFQLEGYPNPSSFTAIRLAKEFYPSHGEVKKAIFIGNVDKLRMLNAV